MRTDEGHPHQHGAALMPAKRTGILAPLGLGADPDSLLLLPKVNHA